MAKYSEAFKLKVAEEYLDGKLSYRRLAEKYEVPTTTLRGWVRIYKYYGSNKLVQNEQKQSVYSVQFKLDVLNFMKSTGASVSDAALQFGIKNPSMISRWRKTFLEGNLGALDKQRGLFSMAKKPNNEAKKKLNNKEESLQKLERENELLRLEVAYLKKLRAFQKDPESYLEKHKQRYHSKSKKNSN
ncbi:helix-turn-helix domain-containing protein [Oceanobacillus bengalensis]|uniref:helix-turn-helix domain-containing protein n=2 Tax=Oceanobacillus bengalensis TaxID=1435466 RepID=UPI00363FE4EE